MKRIFSVSAFVIAGGLLWAIWPLLKRDPEVLAVGVILGLVLGSVVGIPVGLLVLAAQSRNEDRQQSSGRRQPQQPVHYPAMPVMWPPQQQMPMGMIDHDRGSWYSSGPAGYDLAWNEPPLVKE